MGRANCTGRIEALVAATSLAATTTEKEETPWRSWAVGRRRQPAGRRPGRDDVWDLVSTSGEDCPGQKGCAFHQRCFAERAREQARDVDVVVTNHHLLLLELELRAMSDAPGVMLPEVDVIVVDEAHRLADHAADLYGVTVTAARMGRAGAAADAAAKAAGMHTDWSRRLRGRYQELAADLSPGPVQPGGRAHATLVGRPHPLANDLQDHARHPQGPRRPRRRGHRPGRRPPPPPRPRPRPAAPDRPPGPTRRQRERRRGRMGTTPRLPARVAPPPTCAVGRGGRAAGPGWSGRRWSSRARCWRACCGTGAGHRGLLGHPGRGRQPGGGGPGPRGGRPGDRGRLLAVRLPGQRPAVRAPVGAPALLRRVPGRGRARAGLAGRGRPGPALVLCTSWRAVGSFAAALAHLPYELLVQGDDVPARLAARFRDEVASVLVATRTFFEGFDVPGESLSLLVLDRLPFPRPDDPLLAERGRRVERAGRSVLRGLAAGGRRLPAAGARPPGPLRDRPGRHGRARPPPGRRRLPRRPAGQPAPGPAHPVDRRRARLLRRIGSACTGRPQEGPHANPRGAPRAARRRAPSPAAPVAAYVPTVRTGNLVYVSGQVPTVDGKPTHLGHLGDDVDLENGRAAARTCAINLIAALKAELGQLAQVGGSSR